MPIEFQSCGIGYTKVLDEGKEIGSVRGYHTTGGYQLVEHCQTHGWHGHVFWPEAAEALPPRPEHWKTAHVMKGSEAPKWNVRRPADGAEEYQVFREETFVGYVEALDGGELLAHVVTESGHEHQEGVRYSSLRFRTAPDVFRDLIEATRVIQEWAGYPGNYWADKI
ncbi:hypothetical protein [Nonomuraea gerenzanensis]|uniref:hypothetical protein n=1 Tax=Nonomuraea gerenzanensis TaxID=93944 RepID=UPI001CD9F71F|nr:hypothetical protein [Nonomuraea gerenzanensis]UBU12933.1 hypothetical protein LCN96_53280 [Nonomuraea gerenzanensis]